MAEPLRWLWGLAPLALLWGAGNLMLGDVIERDVGRRAVAVASDAAGEATGARSVLARVEGRDVSISGEALSSDTAAKAMAQLRGEFGVRRALGGLSQAVAQRPYSWSATRKGDTVTLAGFVPDEATALANRAAAAASVPSLRIEDRQNLAFGAPPGFEAMTKTILTQLPGLAEGKLALDDTRFCIEGKAETPDSFLTLQKAAGALAQPGFQSVDCGLEPPTVSPYRLSVERSADGALALSGFYPSETMREQIVTLVRSTFPATAVVTESLKPALGEPSSFLLKVTRAVSELARLRSGKAEITSEAYLLVGEGPETYEACQALRLQIAQTDGPDSVAQATIACPPAPPPVPPMPQLPEIPPLFFPPEPPPAAQVQPAPQAPPPVRVGLRWQARKQDGVVTISGLVRDDAARQALLRAASAILGQQPRDGMTTEANLNPESEYAAATTFALELLAKLRRGSVLLVDTELSVSGEVASEADWRALEAALRQQPLPGGLVSSTGVNSLLVRPYAVDIAADRTGLSLRGYVPDSTTRDSLLALAAASLLKGKVTDETTIVPSAPEGFAAAAKLALENVLRLDIASASISETGVALRGLTCRDLIKSEVDTSAAAGRAAGLPVDANVALRQTGCVIDPPNTCQNDLDALTKRNTILFGQGTAVVTLDETTERVIGEAFAILKQCPASQITVEGHANRDGQTRGFDNLSLSERRAQRVRDELARRGLPPEQLLVKGFGIERPLVPHGDFLARAVNRRVQFTVAK